MTDISAWLQRKTTGFLLVMVLTLNLLCPFSATAGELGDARISEAVKSAILSFDPSARFREDAMVTLSTGSSYVLIAPATPLKNDSVKVSQTLPLHSKIPDILVLSDGHFLLRMVALPNGRYSFPIMDNLPLGLRTGLLPQNFSFPQGFLLPTMWKSLTGNLLIDSDGALKADKSYPLALYNPQQQELLLWDMAHGQMASPMPLDCQPADITVSRAAQYLYVGCSDRPQLKIYPLSGGEVHTLSLPAPVGTVLLEERYSHLYVSHPSLPQLSVVDTVNKMTLKPVQLKQPANYLAISPFRKQLYAASVGPTVKTTKSEDTGPQRGITFFRSYVPKSVKDKQAANEEANNTELPEFNVQLINLHDLKVEKIIPTWAEISALHVKDEKTLWMVSNAKRSLWTFDLRWQEMSTAIPLPEAPLGMASDEQWVYLLFSGPNQLYRLNAKNHTWGSPIALEPGTQPVSLTMDPVSHQAYVITSNPAGIAVISLDRAEWAGTQPMPFTPHNVMAWVIPANERPSRQMQIKFQDGRLSIQNEQLHQWAKSLSGPHGQQKSQNPPVPEETQSDPEIRP